MSDLTRTITLDGISYDVAQFSQQVQQAVAIHSSFSADLKKAQLEVLKTQAALKVVTDQISESVQKELEAKKETQKVAADQVPAEAPAAPPAPRAAKAAAKKARA